MPSYYFLNLIDSASVSENFSNEMSKQLENKLHKTTELVCFQKFYEYFHLNWQTTKPKNGRGYATYIYIYINIYIGNGAEYDQPQSR